MLRLCSARFTIDTVVKLSSSNLGRIRIFRSERSALQIKEGNRLADRHPLIVIYLYAYVAEMTLKASYFRKLFGALDEIDHDTRNRATALAQLNGFMERNPHDILGWAQISWSGTNKPCARRLTHRNWQDRSLKRRLSFMKTGVRRCVTGI